MRKTNQPEMDLFDVSITKILEKLVLQYNKDFRSEVFRAKKKYQQYVRNIISDKTGLTLTNKTFEVQDIEGNYNYEKKSQIKINIVDKIPDTLTEILEKHSKDIIELLFHYRKMKVVVKEMDYQLLNHTRFGQFHDNICNKKEIKKAKQFFLKLMAEVEKSGIIDDLRKTTPDYTGRYYPDTNTIEIYWLSIGLFGVLYELPIEHFTLITLIHELAHGYTHKGFDIDGNLWDTENFKKADRHITEGLAQHYTYNICKNYFDFILPSFEEFYCDSSSEYIEYKKWFSSNDKDIFETTRRVLLNARTKNIKSYSIFLKELHRIKAENRKQF